MGAGLSQTQIDAYRADGYLFPLPVLSRADATARRERLEAVEAVSGEPLSYAARQKSHLLFTWLADLVRHPAVLDAVEPLIGPDILCWASSFFIKASSEIAGCQRSLPGKFPRCHWARM